MAQVKGGNAAAANARKRAEHHAPKRAAPRRKDANHSAKSTPIQRLRLVGGVQCPESLLRAGRVGSIDEYDYESVKQLARLGLLTRGDRNIKWIERYCRIPEGKDVGKPVILRPFQRKVIKGIYDTPTRLAIISFGRKNGKTALVACLDLLHLVGPEMHRNSQLFSAAQAREQAGIVFNLAAKMVRFSPELTEVVYIKESAKALQVPVLGTQYRALSADATSAYGLSPVFNAHDELGQVRGPRSELYEALETASGAHEAPLSIIISTQAPNDGDLLSMLIDDAKASHDPRIKLFLWCADENDDPWSEETWRKANPALGDFLSLDEVRSQAEAARRMPSREPAFRNLILNQRVEMKSPFIARSVWDACNRAPDVGVLSLKPVWISIDLSSRQDLTCVMAGARDDVGFWHLFPKFFTPALGLTERAKRDRVPYDLWVKQGFLDTTPGASVDYSFVAAYLRDLSSRYEIAGVPFDRWKMNFLKRELDALDVVLPLMEFGQGFKDMAPAMDATETALLNARVCHGGHPVLRMCVSSAVVTKDPAGNRKLDKAKSTNRIDGAVAMVMLIGAAEGGKPQEEELNLDHLLTGKPIIV